MYFCSLQRAVILATVTLWLCACASTRTVKQSEQLADAGVAYGAAAKDVIELTRDRYLDWHSEAILAELPGPEASCKPKEIVGEQEPSAECADLMKDFEETTKKDQEFVDQLSGLSAHADTLGRYFQSLKSLATYDAKGNAATATEGLLSNINALSDKLESDAKITDSQRTAWGKLAGLVGDSIKAAHLRERLRNDAATIGRAIDIQSGVLDANAALLTGMDQADREVQFTTNVRNPYLTGAALLNPDSWRTNRRLALLPGPEIQQLQTLRSASTSLKGVWEDILSGKGSPESARQVFDDIANALKLINDARKAREKED
jgi:hypothetical protein